MGSPFPHKGRKFNTSQPLGKIMEREGLMVRDVEMITGISYRTISDYLAGRKRIRSDHLGWLSAGLNVEPEELEDVEGNYES